MGAKSNNLKVLSTKLEPWVSLPASGCIPFKMLEYTLSLDPEAERIIHSYIDMLNTVTKVKKMNRILFKCKDIVQKLKFCPEDPFHAEIKTGLLNFGISEAIFE